MKFLVCNFKSNKTWQDIKQYKQDIKELSKNNNLKLILCPSAPFFETLRDSDYELGSQDVSKYNNGAYTGEINAEQISSLGVKYVLVGHSERKKYFKENETDFIDKTKRSLEQNLKVIYFIGEENKENNNQLLFQTIKNQLINLFQNIDSKYYHNLIIAYEPNWSIGTNSIPDINDLRNIIDYIREKINDNGSVDIPLLYGGGVNNNTINKLFKLNNLDGFVIGECSLDINGLKDFYNNYEQKI